MNKKKKKGNKDSVSFGNPYITKQRKQQRERGRREGRINSNKKLVVAVESTADRTPDDQNQN